MTDNLLNTFDDAELDRMVKRAWNTAAADMADWNRCRTDYGKDSEEAKLAFAAYQSSEEHWRDLVDEQNRRRQAA